MLIISLYADKNKMDQEMCVHSWQQKVKHTQTLLGLNAAVASAVYAKEFRIFSVQLRLWQDLTILTKQNLVSKGITMGVIYVYNEC